ncbi:MAG TPA: MaoC family dehydratase [Thermoanaerobaculia bacterium]|nr:MaoC family dehydratase [Thermoanaerobaculia bacterium]
MADRLASFADLAVGQRASLERTISADDVDIFRELSGDANPLHEDGELARRSFFGGPIAHGMLTASMFSTLIGMLLPGTGAIYRAQSLEFLRPVRPGDALRAWGEIRTLDAAANRIEIDTWIENQHGQRVLAGRAVVSLLRGLKPA